MTLTWGIGIEHEMRLFHMPNLKRTKKIEDYIAFDAFNPTLELIEEYEKQKKNTKLTDRDNDYLIKILKTFEPTGRKCNKKWVLRRLPVDMPEFITGDPFAKLPIEDYCEQMRLLERTYFMILKKHKLVNNLINKYGYLGLPPFGMASYIKVPKEITGTTYKYYKKIYEDYTGSFHITLTLPFEKKNKYTETDVEKFVSTHENFANHFQWLEPLFITGFFSCDQKAVGNKEKRVRGSFRIMRVGWGSLAGSDVRKLRHGLGRYSNIKSYWREGLDFHELYKLRYCDKVSIPEKGATSALGANFRTFGSTDPKRPWHRESGAPMTIPNGVEIRIFDHFNTAYLDNLCQIIIYIAANSKRNHADEYVYKNKHWINATQQVMKYGWRAEITQGYIDELEKVLKLKLKPKTMMAYDLFEEVVEQLYNKNKDDVWIKNMVKSTEKPKIPNVNRFSWEHAFNLYLNRSPKYFAKFRKMLKDLSSVEEFKRVYFKTFSKDKWSKNIDDIVYYLETRGIFKNGKVDKTNLVILDHINDELLFDWSDSILLKSMFNQRLSAKKKNKDNIFFKYMVEKLNMII